MKFQAVTETYGTTPSPWLAFKWETPTMGALLTHQIRLEFEERPDESEFSRGIRSRLFCYIVLGRLPDQALPDICDFLRDIYSTYLPVPPRQLPPLAEKFKAKLGRVFTRPEFHAEEEG